MIILRQKQYSYGREYVVLNKEKGIKPLPLDTRALELSKEKKEDAIKKINQSLSPKSMKGRGGSFWRHIRGKEARMRVRMGYNTPEAVEALRQKKLRDLEKDKSLTPEYIKSELERKESTGISESAKYIIENAAGKTKKVSKDLYENTGKVIGKTVGKIRSNPDTALVSAGSTVALGAISPAMAANPVVRPSLLYVGLKDVTGISNLPVKVNIRDKNGRVIKTRKIPLKKMAAIKGRRWQKKAEDIFQNPIKGTLERVRENHHAAHPHEI